MAANDRIALFGGTFDPVHLGHVAMARQAQSQLKLDQVRFLPCRISPHKQDTHPAPPQERLHMLHLATAALPWAEIDDFELQQQGPSYSWKTAEAMKQKFPQSRLFWILGSDQWQALDHWERPAHLASMVEFIAFSRGEAAEPRNGFTLHQLPDVHPANASAIRRDLEGIGRDWLDPRVAAYIREKGLYRTTS